MASSDTGSNVRFFYIRDRDDRPVATVAWRSDGHAGSSSEISMGVSWCSPRDQVKKSTGRQIALGRLNTPGRAGRIVLRGPQVPAHMNLTQTVEFLRLQVLEELLPAARFDDYWWDHETLARRRLGAGHAQ